MVTKSLSTAVVVFFLFTVFSPIAHSSRLRDNTNNRFRGVPSNGTFCGNVAPDCFCRRKKRKEESLTCAKSDCLHEIPTGNITDEEALSFTSIFIVRQRNLKMINGRELTKFLKLRVIRLARNNIQTIHDEAFRNLLRVERLDLHRNKLKTVPTAIKQLVSLKSLNLGGNQLSVVKSDVFARLRNLKHVILSRNKIVEFPTELPISLTKITISNNLISALPDLKYLRQLKSLHLNSNKLKNFPTGKLPVSIRNFRACNNHIYGGFVVADLTNLTVLDISNNPGIMYVNKTSFYTKDNEIYGSMHLQYLLMKNVGLVHASGRAFRCLGHLQYLDLSGNNLTSYNPDWFTGNKRLRNLRLSANPWQCSCELKVHAREIKTHFDSRVAVLSKRTGKDIKFDNDFEQLTCTTQSGHSEALVQVSDFTPETSCSSNIRWKLKRFNPCAFEMPKPWLIGEESPKPTRHARVTLVTTSDREDESPTEVTTTEQHTKQIAFLVTTNPKVANETRQTTVMMSNTQESSKILNLTSTLQTVDETTTAVRLVKPALVTIKSQPSDTGNGTSTTQTETSANRVSAITTNKVQNTKVTTTASKQEATNDATAKNTEPATTTATEKPTTTTATKEPTSTTTTKEVTTTITTKGLTTATTTKELTTGTTTEVAHTNQEPKSCYQNEARTCVFPFKSGGKLVHTCQTSWSGEWCSLSFDYDTDGRWDYCYNIC